jgi:hypothetical protein
MKLATVGFLLGLVSAVIVGVQFLAGDRLYFSEGFVLFLTYLYDLASFLALVALFLSVAAALIGLKLKSRRQVVFALAGTLFSIIALLPTLLAIMLAIAMGMGGAIPR